MTNYTLRMLGYIGNGTCFVIIIVAHFILDLCLRLGNKLEQQPQHQSYSYGIQCIWNSAGAHKSPLSLLGCNCYSLWLFHFLIRETRIQMEQIIVRAKIRFCLTFPSSYQMKCIWYRMLIFKKKMFLSLLPCSYSRDLRVHFNTLFPLLPKLQTYQTNALIFDNGTWGTCVYSSISKMYISLLFLRV